MKMHRRRLGPVGLALAGVLLAACNSGPDGAAGAAGADDGSAVVTVGVTPASNAATVYLGIDQGFFADEDIEVKPQTIQAASAAIPSLLNQQMQFALVSAVPTITAASKGLDVQVVTGNDRYSDDPSEPDGSVLVAAAESGIEDAAGLAGKTVAVVGLKSAPELAVRRALAAAGVDPADVKFVEIAYPDMVAALQSNRVDAAVVVDPYLSQATAAGLEVVMQPFPEGLPGKSGTEWIAATNYLKANADVATRFASAMDKAVAYAAANPDAVREIMGSYTKISAEARKNVILPQFDSEVTGDDLEFYADAMKQEGFIADEFDTSGLLWKR